MKKVFVWALAGAALALAATANATNCSNAAYKSLKFFSGDTGAVTWQDGTDYFGFVRSDSPRDANHGRLLVHMLIQHYPADIDMAGAYGNCTGIENKLVGNVKNLSFDFMNGSNGDPVHVGAGSPRYSVDIDTDGDNVADTSAFLAAFYCQAVIEDPAWSRADFTGRTDAGCTIYVGAEVFTSDGVKSAWRLLADAHPTWKVKSAYLVMDEAGTAILDRLAFQNQMFQQAGSGTSAIKSCGSETAC